MSDTKKKKTEEPNADENTGAALDPNSTPAAADPAAEAAKIIADAEAKAAAIVAAAEAKAAEAKAGEDQPTAKVDPAEELVWYEAPLLPGVKKRDILVAVNGETLRIQRGVRVQIKEKFREALQNAAKQEYAAFEAREEIKKQGEKALASM